MNYKNIIILPLVCYLGAAVAQTKPVPVIFTADWIGCPGENLKAYGVYLLRKSFDLPAKPNQFVVHVSGDQRYRLFVNGHPACFGPARGDLRNWNYETIDLAPWLKTGKNLFAVMLWNMGKSAPAAQVSYQTGFILQGEGKNEQAINTNNSWLIRRDEGYHEVPPSAFKVASYIAGGGDSVVFKNHPTGWQLIDYDDSNWSKAISEPKERYYTDKRQLKPRPIPMMEETTEPINGMVRVTGTDFSSISKSFNANGSIIIPAKSKVSILYDRKTLTTAYPEINFSGGENSTVKITYAESLFDDKNLKGNRDEINGKHIKGCYDVFLPDGGKDRLFRPLWMRTFRYIQFDITTRDEALRLNRLTSVFTAYPFKQNATFTTDNESLQKIWNVSWHTARLCANETYMDCPYYEQLQYVGDTRIQALISLYVSGDDRLMRNAIEQFHQSQTPDGLTLDAYPAGGGKFIPPFSLFWIAMLHDYSMYRNDQKFVSKYLIPMESILKWFEYRIDKKSGMLGKLGYWNFVDWSFSFKGIPSGGMDGNSAILSLQYVFALQQASHLFTINGQPQKAGYYQALATKIKSAVYHSCYDTRKGLLADSPEKTSFSQHANIWAILTDCTPLKDQQTIMKKVTADTSLIQTSLYYRFYYTRALKKAGLGNLYLSSLGPWEEALALGLSTFPETLAPNVRSDCHAWSASPCFDFLNTICGIESTSPGFKSVHIEPHLGNLGEVFGAVPHPLGIISVHYRRVGHKRYLATINLPGKIPGTFISGNKFIKLSCGQQTFLFQQ